MKLWHFVMLIAGVLFGSEGTATGVLIGLGLVIFAVALIQEDAK